MTEYITKLNQLDLEIDNDIVHNQVNEIKQIDNYIKSKKPLPEAPARLGLLPDQFEDVLMEIGENKRSSLTTINNLFNNCRQYLSLEYGIWSVANLKTARLIKEKFVNMLLNCGKNHVNIKNPIVITPAIIWFSVKLDARIPKEI